MDHYRDGAQMSDILPLFSLTFILFTLLVFMRAALHKAFDFTEFQGFVADYRLVPEALVKPAAGLLLAAELSASGLLLVSASRPLGLILAALILALYAVAIGINLYRGHTRIECGCGGTPQLLNTSLVWRNAALIIIALLPLLKMPAGLAPLDTSVCMAAAVFMLVLYLLFEQANANFIAIFSKIS
jgi:hypothetical protein